MADEHLGNCDAPTAAQQTTPEEMSEFSNIEGVRLRVRKAFTDLGAAPESTIHETILIQNGIYCGRKLWCDDLLAILFQEEDELKIYRGNERIHRDLPIAS